MPDATEPQLLIERVDPSTFESVLPLIADYQRFYGQDPDESRNRKFFGELLDDNPHGLQIAARQGPQVITSLTWETAPDNRSARALYDRFLLGAADTGGSSTWIHYAYPLSAEGEQ